MDPAARNLIQVTIEDAAEAEQMVTALMGDRVEGSARNFWRKIRKLQQE